MYKRVRGENGVRGCVQEGLYYSKRGGTRKKMCMIVNGVC